MGNKRLYSNKGEKRLFLLFGIINFLITNTVLQISLLILPTVLATVLSQVVNFLIGYNLYGKKVFKLDILNKLNFKKYLFLATFLWISNFLLIQSLYYIGFNKNLVAFLIIPLLVAISYLSQKYYVFK